MSHTFGLVGSEVKKSETDAPQISFAPDSCVCFVDPFKMASQSGQLFRISTWGESHGGGVGVVVDGCPPLVELCEADIQSDLDRRRPGQSEIVTPRAEADECRILSGVFQGKTLGTPISVVVMNQDARPEAYSEMETAYRPSHADYTYQQKYGIRNWQGGGRASARETIGRVAAAAIARKFLATVAPELEVVAYVKSIHELEANVDSATVQFSDVEANIVRCPDPAMVEQMIALIKQMRKDGNSVGGTIECVVRGVPVGLGEPVFDKMEADLAKAMLSLPATKGFEIGSGFAGTRLTGAEHNDPFEVREGHIRTATNFSGGIQGGITNGEDIFFRVAFKPTATITRSQKTVTTSGEDTELAARGRHDPCVLPRAVPMVEAMVWLVLADHMLRQRALRGG
ncbi:MAG TPA: chorismate synthase [Chthoniobacterales bacterium]